MVDVSLTWYDFNRKCWCLTPQANIADGIISLGFFNTGMNALTDTNKETHLIDYAQNISDRCSSPHLPNLIRCDEDKVCVSIHEDEIGEYKLNECPKEYLIKLGMYAQQSVSDIHLVLLNDKYEIINPDGFDVYIFKHGQNKWSKLGNFKLFDHIKAGCQQVAYIGLSIINNTRKKLNENQFYMLGFVFYV